jgi:hypothetical protein
LTKLTTSALTSVGDTMGTLTDSGLEIQGVVQVDADAHILGTAPTYILHQSPRVTTAAATDFFDLFNATGSGKIIRLKGLYAVLQVTAAHAFVVTWQFSVGRTSAVGTGGAAHTFEGAAAPAAGALNISRASTVKASTLPAQITSRSLPTGGATASHFLFMIGLGSEETLMSATHQVQHINWLELYPDINFELQENQGIKIRQITAVASTGINFGWTLAFEVVP